MDRDKRNDLVNEAFKAKYSDPQLPRQRQGRFTEQRQHKAVLCLDQRSKLLQAAAKSNANAALSVQRYSHFLSTARVVVRCIMKLSHILWLRNAV